MPNVVSYMDENEGFFVGLFTGLLFFATIGLWRSSNTLWATGEHQFALSERAAISLEGFITEITTATDSRTPPGALSGRYRDDPGLYLTRFAIIPQWKNTGKTPTKNMTIQVRWGVPDRTLISDATFTYRTDPIPFFIAPGGEELSAAMEIPAARALIDWSFNPVEPSPLILIWGRADYEDIFGNRHILEWCRELRLDRHDGIRIRANFIQWGWYNRSYEP